VTRLQKDEQEGARRAAMCQRRKVGTGRRWCVRYFQPWTRPDAGVVLGPFWAALASLLLPMRKKSESFLSRSLLLSSPLFDLEAAA
jgi:hypothetical protein